MATEVEDVRTLLDEGLGRSTVIDEIFKPIAGAEPPPTPSRTHHVKISVIGVGHVGMTIAQTILTQDLIDELVLVDSNAAKLRGEMLDLQHAAAFLPRVKITASTDYDVTVSSQIVIIAAGVRQMKPGETLRDLMPRNVEVFKEIVPKLVEMSPDAILMVVSNPVDTMTYVAWKLSGFPPNRVIGSGTNLDTSRFRFLLADFLEVNAQDVEAYMVGEHGDNSLILQSSVSIGGVPILSFLEERVEDFASGVLEVTRRSVVESVHKVLRFKGYTSWAIGYSVASLVRSILRDQRKIHPVSVLASGHYGVPDDKEVFLSLPAELGSEGVVNVVNVHLTEDEAGKLRDSAEALSGLLQILDL